MIPGGAGWPTDPGPSHWALEITDPDGPDDLVAVGADLAPSTVLAAYRAGLFPMGLGEGGGPPLGWWSPAARGVLLPGDHHVSRSLRRTRQRFDVRVNTAFDAVVTACGDPRRDGAWITEAIRTAYGRLHRLGWAHSVEVYDDRSRLVGGLYGLAIGGLFAGESMFHLATDASKVAVWALAEIVFADDDARRMVDVQWQTPHLATLGVRELTRRDYLTRLDAALAASTPERLRNTA